MTLELRFQDTRPGGVTRRVILDDIDVGNFSRGIIENACEHLTKFTHYRVTWEWK